MRFNLNILDFFYLRNFLWVCSFQAVESFLLCVGAVYGRYFVQIINRLRMPELLHSFIKCNRLIVKIPRLYRGNLVDVIS